MTSTKAEDNRRILAENDARIAREKIEHAGMTDREIDDLKRAPSRGRGKAIGQLNGVARSEVQDILETFKLLPENGRAAFSHTWVSIMAKRLEETWPVFYLMLKAAEEHEVYKDPKMLALTRHHKVTKTYATFQEYFEDVVQAPFTKWAELEQTYHFVSTHAPHLFKEQYADARKQAVAALAEKTQPLAEHRRPTKEEEQSGKGSDRTFTPIKRGDNATYWTARIARDHPRIHEEMKAGKYKSVRAAAKAAGIIKEATPLERTQRDWLKLSRKERSQFLAWTKDQD